MANRWGIPKSVEELVRVRDLKCIYCGISFISSILSIKTRPSWEHITNDIRTNRLENIALCCGSRNAIKGSKTLIDWLESKYCFDKGITKENVTVVKPI